MNFEAKKAIGLSAALPIEIKPLLDLLPEVEACSLDEFRIHKSSYKLMPIVIIETGMGKERAARSVEYLFKNFDIERHIGFGMAGAIDPQFRTGTVALPDRVSLAGHLDDFIPLDPIRGINRWSGELVSGGIVVEVDRPFHTKDKLALAQTGAVMVDMESHATSLIAKKYNRPVTIARVIVDEADYDLEPIVRNKKQGFEYGNFLDMAKVATSINAEFVFYAIDKIIENLPAT